MKKQRTVKSKIVAASPMVHEPGMLPYRIVIRDLGDQFVVHTEVNEQQLPRELRAQKLPGATPFQSLFSSSSVQRAKIPGRSGSATKRSAVTFGPSFTSPRLHP